MRLFIVQCKGDTFIKEKSDRTKDSHLHAEKRTIHDVEGISAFLEISMSLVALSVAFSISSLSLPFSVKNYLPFLECYSFSASSKLISFPSSPQKDLVWKSQNTRSKPRTQVIPIKILRRKQELMTQ